MDFEAFVSLFGGNMGARMAFKAKEITRLNAESSSGAVVGITIGQLAGCGERGIV